MMCCANSRSASVFRITLWFLACFILLFSSCGKKKEIKSIEIAEYRITCHIDSLNGLMQDPYSNRYIDATVERGGKSYKAKMRVRGDSSRGFSKKSIKLKLELGGDKKESEVVNLNAEYLDKTYVRQHLSSKLFELMNLVCFETSYAPVYLNGDFYGLFLRVENMDKDFLKKRGLSTDANMYKAAKDGASLTRFDSLAFHWEKKTNRSDSWDDLFNLIQDIDTCSPEGMFKYVKAHFDYQDLVGHVALNFFIRNGSTYYHNYYMYRDGYGDGKWRIFPWDLDKTVSSYDWKLLYEVNNGAVPDNGLISKLLMSPDFMLDIEKELVRIDERIGDFDFEEYAVRLKSVLKPYVAMDTTDQINDVEDWSKAVDNEVDYIGKAFKKCMNDIKGELQPFSVVDLTREPMYYPTIYWTRIPDDKKNGIEYEVRVSRIFDFPDEKTKVYKVGADSLFSLPKPLDSGKWFYKVLARKGEKYLTGYGRHYYFTIETKPSRPPSEGNELRFSKQGSPYLLERDFVVNENQNMIIEPGARIYLNPNVNIRIYGKLLAQGKTSERIFLRSASSSNWGVLELMGDSNHQIISHIDFSNGRLVMHSCKVSMKNIVFYNFLSDLNRFEGRPSLVWSNNSIISMDSCRFMGNQTGEGINLHKGFSEVKNSIFIKVPDAIELISADSGIVKGNWVENSGDDAIDLNNCRNVKIIGNLITNCFDKSISVGVDKTGKSQSISVIGNMIYSNRIGCEVKDSSTLELFSNVFVNNGICISAKTKDDGYEMGGSVMALGNIFKINEGQKYFQIDGNSKLTEGTSERRNYFGNLCNSQIFDLAHTPYYPVSSDKDSLFYDLRKIFYCSITDSIFTIHINSLFPIDLGGCYLAYNDEKLFSFPTKTMIMNGGKVKVCFGKRSGFDKKDIVGPLFKSKNKLKRPIGIYDKEGKLLFSEN
ncbi:MAG: CotH kinase family protein [Bacteroidota bacterium]|jgi:hypothetical protein